MTPVTLTVLQKPQAVQHPLSPTLFKTPPILLATEADQYDEKPSHTAEQVSVNEVKKILANGVVEATLPWLPEEDVAFDMDEVVEEEIVDEDDDDSSDAEDDKKDIGWIKEGE